tara:strand:+ start:675 stop:1163 length:489 start_codon:yes stop_codon:yes gene_type:complete
MKILNDNPTNQVFIALMDYRVDHEGHANSEYGFGYFELDNYSISRLNHFHDNWDSSKRDYTGIIVDIPELFLINSNYIHNLTNEITPDLKGIKLDSINFLESKPVIDYPNMIKGVGSILTYRENFIIQCKDIEDRGFSYTIYQSIPISYWKINHLLKRKKPI